MRFVTPPPAWALVLMSGVLVLVSGVHLVSAAAASAATLGIAPSTTLAGGATVTATIDAPIVSIGQTTQTLRVEWGTDQATLTGPAIAPTGWTPEYTTDGTAWSATLPSNLSTVRGARASGPVTSDGASNGRQTATTTNTASSVTAEPSFPSAGGGDGYDIFTSARYIMTVVHHSADYTGGVIISCWLRSTGQACSPAQYTKPGFQTSYAANGVVVGTKVYVMAQNDTTGTVGLVCTDISALPFADCGYTALVTPASGYYNPPRVFAGTIAVSGTRIYGGVQDNVNWGTLVSKWDLTCYDTATGQPCAGQPYLTGAYAQGGTGSTYTSAFDGKVFIVGRTLWCVNGADGSPCSGWGTSGSPLSVDVSPYAAGGGATNPVPMRDASGTVTGVCVLWNGGSATPPATAGPACWTLGRASATVPAGLASLAASKPVTYGGL
ncbi:MAG: hypothetical protein ACR2J9_09675, partial [Gaiellales bacterium]